MTAPVTRRRHVPDGMVLALACVAQFMVVLDVSIVNVALPSVGHDLHYSASGLQWVVNAYVLTFAGFLLFGGRAADLFGRRRGLPVRAGPVHPGQPGRRPGPGPGLADRGPRRPGRRRRLPVAGHPDDHRHHLHRPAAAGQGHRGVERRRRRGRRRRVDPRRRAHRGVVLAMGLVRQPPHRHRHRRGRRRLPDRTAPPGQPGRQAAARHRRRGDDHRRAQRPRLRHHRDQHPPVAVGRHPGAPGGGGGRCWPRSRSSSCGWRPRRSSRSGCCARGRWRARTW